MERLRKGIFPSIIALSALSVSLSAAFYSVSGLGKLFAGVIYRGYGHGSFLRDF